VKLGAILLAFAATARAEPLPTTELHLPNGATVVLAPDPSVANAVLHVRVPAGAVAGDAAELVLRALDTLDAPLDAAGGWSTAQLARDHASFTLEVPGEALPRALFLQAERLVHASAAAALDRAGEVERDRRALADSREGLVAAALGTAATGPLQATRAAVDAVLHTRYGAANLVVVIAGRFTDAAARDAIAAYLGALPAGAPVVAAAPPSAPGHGALRHDHRRGRVTVAFAVPEPLTAARLDVEIAARALAMRLAGSELRLDPPFALEATGSAGRAEIDAALRALRDAPLSADELARAVAMLELEQVTALEGLAFRAQAIGEAVAHAHTPQYLERWRALLAAATPATVQATARAWLDPSHAVVVLGDAP